jgi:hypothetical protein
MFEINPCNGRGQSDGRRHQSRRSTMRPSTNLAWQLRASNELWWHSHAIFKLEVSQCIYATRVYGGHPWRSVNRSKAAASLWLEAVTEVHPGRLGRVFTYVAQATNERPHASHEMMAEEVAVQDGIVRYVFLGR